MACVLPSNAPTRPTSPTEVHVLRLLVGEGFLGAGAAVPHVRQACRGSAGDGSGRGREMAEVEGDSGNSYQY